MRVGKHTSKTYIKLDDKSDNIYLSPANYPKQKYVEDLDLKEMKENRAKFYVGAPTQELLKISENIKNCG